MEPTVYLDWLVARTRTAWWHDSADADELALALKHGATGVTTNPVLNMQALRKGGAVQFPELGDAGWRNLPEPERSEWLTGIVVKRAARTMEPEFRRSGGAGGYVCAQVDPGLAGDRGAMLGMARRFAALAPNIAVKLPATASGLDVLERCIGEGITCTATVSFTVPQVLAAAESHARGIRAAQRAGAAPGHCFAVIMIGRLDDYLRDAAADGRADVTEAMIRQAGLAVAKRAYAHLREAGSQTRLCVAALRGAYHLTELAGGDLVMSIHPKYQEPFSRSGLSTEERIGHPVDPAVIDHLRAIPEFRRAYEPDGMRREEFIGYGATQRTLSQFCETGWNPLGHLAV